MGSDEGLIRVYVFRRCPAVLSPSLGKNRFGVAQTLLNDRAAYISSQHTCAAGSEVAHHLFQIHNL